MNMNRIEIDSKLTRRNLLGCAAAAAAGALGRAASAQETRPAENSLRERARRNLKLSIFGGVYGRHLELEEAAARMRADGFVGVMFDYAFKDVRFEPLDPDWDLLERIMRTLERNGLHVAGLYGYYNLIDPDPRRLREGEARMELLIRHWKRFGTPIISLVTGTRHPDSPFAWHEENATEEAYQQVKAVFERWARLAEKTGAIVAPEVYVQNVIGTLERTERLLKEVASPALKITMDPCNYFRNEDLPRMTPMLDEIFRKLGDHIVVAHAKDVKEAPGWPALPGPGLGQMDYPAYLRHLAALDRPMDLVVEHLNLDDVPRAVDFVRKQIDALA